jgi:phosphoribosylformimino-5-aminoimidazole carboxamide ribotide isomerase
MKIIPAIDIIDGKCVRLSQGDYNQKKIYNENPVEVALSFQDAGLKSLHLVDLDGAKAGKVTNWKVIESVCSKTQLDVDFGGGIKTEEEVKAVFSAGVKQINLGSIAVKKADLVAEWISKFGADKIILSADVRDEMIAIGGWLESATLHIRDFVSDYLTKGISYVTCTDISTDGMLKGPNVELYRSLLKSFPSIHLIASGGVSSMHDLEELKKAGVHGVIVGKAIYEGRVQLKDLSALTFNS